MSGTPTHVIITEHGHYCAGCGEALDWDDDDCPCCGGDGFEDEADCDNGE